MSLSFPKIGIIVIGILVSAGFINAFAASSTQIKLSYLGSNSSEFVECKEEDKTNDIFCHYSNWKTFFFKTVNLYLGRANQLLNDIISDRKKMAIYIKDANIRNKIINIQTNDSKIWNGFWTIFKYKPQSSSSWELFTQFGSLNLHVFWFPFKQYIDGFSSVLENKYIFNFQVNYRFFHFLTDYWLEQRVTDFDQIRKHTLSPEDVIRCYSFIKIVDVVQVHDEQFE